MSVTRLGKVAMDNGFDLELPRENTWLRLASTQAPLRLWLSTFGDAIFVVGFSQLNVARALTDHGIPMSAPLPPGTVAGRTTRRAIQVGSIRAPSSSLAAVGDRDTGALVPASTFSVCNDMVEMCL